MDREICLLKNKNLIIATLLFIKVIEEDFSRTKLKICDKCQSDYDQNTRKKLHSCLKTIRKDIEEMRDILGVRQMSETIGEGLIRIGAMTEEQVQDVLKKQEKGDARLFGEIAMELGYVDEDAIMKYLIS